jgi:DNA-binding HxlR family transcriptional regulator
MALLDLLGRRWALRLIWELRDAPCSFRELQARCENMSASVLNQRLAELRDADILELGEHGFALTDEGQKLLDAYPPYQAWAQRWAERTRGPRRRPAKKAS